MSIYATSIKHEMRWVVELIAVYEISLVFKQECIALQYAVNGEITKSMGRRCCVACIQAREAYQILICYGLGYDIKMKEWFVKFSLNLSIMLNVIW